MPHKICVVTTVHGPFDDRIFHKQCRSLEKAGHGVTLMAPHKRNETVDGIKIVALPKINNRVLRILGLVPLSVIYAIKERADIYHFHDPELLPAGLLLKMITGKRIIYDVHEDYKAAIHDKAWLPKFSRRITAFLFDLIEKKSAAFYDGIITATADIAPGFPAFKTAVIRNLPVCSMIAKIRPQEVEKKKPAVIYAGGLSRIRGIKEVVEAVGLLEGAAELWLLGSWESDDFQKECEACSGWKFTKYMGFRRLDEVYAHIKAADIGVHCINPLPRYLKGLPVKYFEYLACGIPVIMSTSELWKKLFGECALFADPLSPGDIAGKITKMIRDAELRERLVKNGKKLIYSEYNWETESNAFLEFYGNLMKKELCSTEC